MPSFTRVFDYVACKNAMIKSSSKSFACNVFLQPMASSIVPSQRGGLLWRLPGTRSNGAEVHSHNLNSSLMNIICLDHVHTNLVSEFEDRDLLAGFISNSGKMVAEVRDEGFTVLWENTNAPIIAE